MPFDYAQGRPTWHLAVAMATCLAAAVALQVRRDSGWRAYEPPTPLMWLQAGPAMKRAALGYDALIADVYWMRAVVYFGQQRLSTAADKSYDLLYPMLELVTQLDPRFRLAYRFGAIFLSEPYPSGPDRPDLAIQLLQRGLERDPNRWEYARDIGFVYAWTYRDYQTAADWFQKASEMPNAPIWLKSTAAMTLTRGGDREAARALWRELYDTAEADALRKAAESRLAQLDALDQIDQLNTIVSRYKARAGRFPANWEELAYAGLLRGVPLDPAGVPYLLDRTNENVKLADTSPLAPLPTGLDASTP
jgi:tetratricopeptide (TPR) repeat protein